MPSARPDSSLRPPSPEDAPGNEVSSRLAGNAFHSRADHIYQQAPRFIGIERRHDFGSLRQPGYGRVDQTWLGGIRFATQAGITGSVLHVRKQHGMGHSINGAFSQNQTTVARSCVREPQPLSSSSSEACKSAILDFVAAQSRDVEMGKHCIPAAIGPHPAGKPWRRKQTRRQPALVF